jgi:hypothetical protein
VQFDRRRFVSPLEELRQLASGAVGSVKISDAGHIAIIEWRRGKRPTSDAEMAGQKVGDRRRMLGLHAGHLSQITGLPAEHIRAIEDGLADLGTHHTTYGRSRSIALYTDCLEQLEKGVPHPVRRRWY